jgi:Ca2+-transporting ATPase
MEALIEQHVHHLPAEEVLELLGSNAEHGLDIFEIESRTKQFGPNSLPMRDGPGALARFLLQFHQPLVYILIIAAIVTAALQEWVDSIVILGVVLVNAVIGYAQESKAADALSALAKTVTTDATVLRAGDVRKVRSTELVPGDIIMLQSGDKVPADIYLIHSLNLQVDESALTGESVPVEKHLGELPLETPLADRKNIAFSSTLVTYGQGKGVVFATGSKTEVGYISELISTADVLETPLTRKIHRFSRLLLIAILLLAGVMFFIGFLHRKPAYEMFMAAVAMAVAAIPEGLPAAVTITLALGMARMAKCRAIIRRLPAVETLGSTTIICSDKTGTLTKNQMTIRNIWSGDERFEVTGAGYAPSGVIKNYENQVTTDLNLAALETLKAGLLCNDSRLVEKEGCWEVQGDPTEGALIASAAKAGLNSDNLLARTPRINTIPFESQHQYMATLHANEKGQSRLYVKGAVEIILSKCTSALDRSGKCVPLNVARIEEEFDRMAATGLRVLAFACREVSSESSNLSHTDVANLEFLGFQGMIDPPRPEAITAVAACQTAGIRVKMITGDHALTASAIAKQIGLNLSTGKDHLQVPKVITGRELAGFSDEKLINVAETVAVFARINPEEKLRLVRALQVKGHIVAMTGDGVNDAPALKQANIGVAIGVGGTEVAKEAADMILTDDNFASIEAAVEEGRGVFDNLTKFIVWVLPTSLGEGLVILAAVFLGVALPVLPVQILWINMTTTVLLGLVLAFEPKEADIMHRPPRNPKTPILTKELIGRIFLVGVIMLLGAFGLFRWALASGASVAEAQTVAVNVFVMVELFYLFNCRSLTKSMLQIGLFTNLWAVGGVTGMVLLQLFYTYVPVMNQLFHSAPISGQSWLLIIAVSLAAYFIVGVEKWVRYK